MIRTTGTYRVLASFLIWVLGTGVSLGEASFIALVPQGSVTTPATPNYGTTTWVRTTVPATSFLPGDRGDFYSTSGSLGRYGAQNSDQHFYAALDLPAGAIVEYLGLNNLNDGTNAAMGVALWDRYYDGVKTLRAGLSSSPHTNWASDFNLFEYNYQVLGHSGITLILDVEIGSSPNNQYFGFVEVVWKRVVSPKPASATFPDVPTNHPFFQFVEALHKAGITGGYPDGRFGVDDPITRGQMAVFLATALGLHWAD